jgi:sulfite reductase beta subunit-like hemoprotein
LSTQTGQTQTRSQEEIYQESLELSKSSVGIIPFIDYEIQRLEEEAAAFVAGEREVAEFTPFRLRQGVYGQRQADAQMIRVKIPGGILTPEALDVLGDIAKDYAPLEKGHITTRENVQYHHIPLDRCPEVLRLLGSVGLSSREACGNTVRNVIGSPTAGVCVGEVFNPTPYLTAYVRFGLRHPISQNFPRKWKSAFTGCDHHDHVAAAIQDLTYVAQIREEGGVQKKGFKVFVGGGTSIMPKLAKPLYDFVAEEDYLRVALALWTVFNNAETLRKNRMMARVKVLIDRIGLDTFRELVDAELEKIGPIDPKPYMTAEELQRETPPNPTAVTSNGHNGADGFQKWQSSNVVAQSQQGFNLVHVAVRRGDLNPGQFKGLAEIVRRYTGGRAVATLEQNVVLRWVPNAYLHDVWHALQDIDLANPGAESITDVTSCPGTDSCKLGITSSMGLSKAISDEIGTWNGLLEDEEVQKVRIKISGCPNGCGQHHIANIGFHGAAVKGPDGQQIPAYELFLGGNYGGSSRIEDSRIGTRIPLVKVPAKAVPTIVREITSYFKENRQETEGFNAFLDRVGLEELTTVAANAQQKAKEAEAGSDLYFDWERSNIYKLERGEGECMV